MSPSWLRHEALTLRSAVRVRPPPPTNERQGVDYVTVKRRIVLSVQQNAEDPESPRLMSWHPGQAGTNTQEELLLMRAWLTMMELELMMAWQGHNFSLADHNKLPWKVKDLGN